VDVSEQAVNPDKAGVLPSRLFGTPLLNLGAALPYDGVRCAIPGGCPARMIDLGSVRLEGVRRGASARGAVRRCCVRRSWTRNGDGCSICKLKFEVLQARIERGDDEACTTGAFRTLDATSRRAIR